MPESQHNEPTNIIIQKPNVMTLAWVLIDIILSKKPHAKVTSTVKNGFAKLGAYPCAFMRRVKRDRQRRCL